MNCRRFTEQVGALARGELLEAALRKEALDHAGTCAACARQLADERKLSAALRSVVVDSARHCAPARVESALMAAFRERVQAVPMPAPAPVAPIAVSGTRPWLWRASVAAGALAASVAVLMLFGLVMRVQREPVPFVTPEQAREAAMLPAADVRHSQTPSGVTAAAAGTGPIVGLASGTHSSQLPASRGAKRASTSPRRMVRARISAPAVRFIETMTVSSSVDESTFVSAGVQERGTEAVSEFYSLNGGNHAAPLDAGQVVRVQMPRASLASLGLPVNSARALGESVIAEVLLSEDGIARAIRLLR
ncbi:MAG: hypothetical protein H0T45_03185 [Pyrinomonadaceae bacterium]|nr:hypothetical protein [Pyrinomonadaceae bacterium]